MYPTLYSFGETGTAGIHTYGLMILTALVFAFMVSSKRARTIGIDPDELPLMYLLVAVAGILGARLFYFLFSDTANFLPILLSFLILVKEDWSFMVVLLEVFWLVLPIVF